MAIIRTTYHSRLSSLANETTQIASHLAETQMKAITGLQVARPSDDPGRISRLHGIRAQYDDQQIWIDNASWAENIQNVAGEAVSSISDALARARELATQYASETYSDDARIEGATEASALFETVIESANANIDGRYVFAGTAYDQPAYDAVGTYQGSTDEPEVLVGDGISVQTGFAGSDILQGAYGDIVTSVSDLVTALQSGLAANVQDVLDDLDDATQQMAVAQSKLGAEMNMSADAADLATQLEVELANQLSSIADADVVEAYTRLTQLQVNYEAALQVTTNTTSTLLFSRL